MIDNEIVSKEYCYFCTLIGDQCGDTSGDPPDCSKCETRKKWKASGNTIEEFWREEG